MLVTQISHLEYICKHKTDTMNDLQQNQEDALEKMSQQLKAQEHWWQKEKQYLDQQYSNVLAEIHARSQVWCCELLTFFSVRIEWII